MSRAVVDETDIDPAIFQRFAELEKEFAQVELDALRRKEFALGPSYRRRNELSSRIPSFWPAVFVNGPPDFQTLLDRISVDVLLAVKTLNVERYQVESETKGEPRSLRFTFEFNENEWFEDTKVVKEFQFVGNGVGDGDGEGSGSLISNPVTFRWKPKGKKENNGLLDLVVDLYKAEEAVKLKDGKSGLDLEVVDRETLWQYEKLREKLEKMEEDDSTEPCFLDWFGYRGPVAKKTGVKKANGKGGHAEVHEDVEEEDDDDDDDDDDGMLDVEIFPPGESITTTLAEDMWPNAMDYFMASLLDTSGDSDVDSFENGDEVSLDDVDDAPELVEVEDVRPAKRQRQS